MSLLVNGLALLGLIFIIVFSLIMIVRAIKKRTQQVMLLKQRPTADYMQNIGLKCPDYWYLNNTDNTNYYCSNNQKLKVPPVSTNPNCPNVKCLNPSGMAQFTVLPSSQTWATMSDADKKAFVNQTGTNTISRCQWIKCCGQNNKPAVWLGVANQCN